MMIETSAARPYAIAAYETAAETHTLKNWAEVLESLAKMTEQPLVAQLFLNPNYSADVLAAVVIDLAAKSQISCSKEQANFIRLLAQANKLQLLSDVKKIFDYLETIFNETADVTVTSAELLTDDYKAKLQQALNARFKHDVNLTFNQDPSLLAGLLIRTGDRVIDGTVKTQLQRFTEALKVGTCN